MSSWRTTLLGYFVLLGSIFNSAAALFDNDPKTTINVQEILTAAVGVGLIAARDNGVTSERAGAK